MPRLFVFLVILLAVGAGGFFLYKTLQGQPVTQEKSINQSAATASPAPAVTQSSDPCEILVKGSADLPPLYSGVSWSEPETGVYDVPLRGEAPQKIDGCLIRTENVMEKISSEIRRHYSLEKYAWENLVVADGMYSSTVSYRSGDNYFVFRSFPDPKSPKGASAPPIIVELFYAQ